MPKKLPYTKQDLKKNKDLSEELYPKDFSDNLVYRYKIIAKCANDPKGTAIVLDRCRNDILFWVNTFVMTYNPRGNKDSVIPFISYGFQDEFILELKESIENGDDILVDKSRDMGISWCVLIVFTWFWLFKGEGMDFLCGSRKEEYVDKIGDLSTLLEKVRFIIRNQPKWMRPQGYVEKEHATFMRIRNPKTKSLIKGESMNQNFSRGGRQKAILMDELAFWQDDEAAWRSSADTTPCRIAISTPQGFNNKFAKLRHGGNIKVKSFHWSQHPDKSQEWYDEECRRRNYDKVEIAQELDISYEGSEEGVLFAWDEMNRAKHTNIHLSTDRIVLVVDPATEGDDAAIIYVSNNGSIAHKKKIKECKPEQLAADIVMTAIKYQVQVIMGDAIGNDVLAVVRVLLRDNKSKIIVVEFKSSEKAINKEKYYNRRTEAYFEAADMMRSGALEVDDDHDLMKQLSATKYKTKNGRKILIPKEEIKQVCGSSPDEADAWVLIPQALKLTHSRREVEYKQNFRMRRDLEYTPSGNAYGDWGDSVTETYF